MVIGYLKVKMHQNDPILDRISLYGQSSTHFIINLDQSNFGLSPLSLPNIYRSIRGMRVAQICSFNIFIHKKKCSLT